ncbi:hemagglutinin repeat-containing protein [Neisseria sp. Marseille-Q6792]|uniref:hemagglutinin repeat-containing protein n=1 Tax=Neisseria sp. Marseille-Q6792 TaxID=2937985 RepID=UPI0020251ECB|nr:hemagglutinin repeat-containing protein [Neisseria sp. Marseille-Q6792]
MSVEAGFGFKTAGKEQNQNYRQSRQSSLKAGGDINIRSREGDITVQGSNITAGDTIRLDSARDIRLLSAQDSQHQDGKNRNAGVQVGVGVSVGAQTGVYIYAEAAYGKGKNRTDSQTHQNTLLQSDKLQLSSKGNTVLNGAQAHARRIDADVGGTLYIESPQDTVEQESKQSGGGIRAQVALGTAWSVSGNYNQSKASGHSRSVSSQSGLFAGEGGYHITADSVRLKGGAIASAADKDHNELTARSFSFEDLRNESSYSASSMGIGAGYGGSLKGSDGFNQSAFGRASQTAGQNMNKGFNYSPTLPQHESGNSQGYTRSVLSEGNITIGGKKTSARALGIHTDSATAHHGADSVPDLQNLLDKQQTIAQSTAAIHSAVGTYRGNRAKAAAEELEKQQAAYEGRLKEQNDGSYEQYAGKSDSERLAMRLGNAKYAQAYQEARSWGVGGSKSRALSAAETLITGALGGQGDLQLAANTLAPYAAAAIGKRFGHGENKNEAAQAIGHFMLGAALAYANGADPLAGGSAAVATERAAEYLAKQYDDGRTAIDPITGKFNPNLLPEHIKEEIKAQTGAVASVVGAAGGSLKGTNSSNGALFDAQVAGTVGQNAVENNAAGNSTSAVTRMQSRAATLENSVYAMDFFGLLWGNVPAIAAEAQKVSRARMDHWNEEARKYLLKEHGINVPLIEVMENVNGVGVIRQDTERNYKNLRAALDKANRLKKNTQAATSATPTNRGRIGSKLIGNGISLDAPKSQQKTVDKIKQGLDKDGKLTEQVVNAWAKEMGWQVIPGGKYGSNNGFDHVFVTPTGQVVLGDSKQIVKNAMHLIPSAAGGHMQMSDNWVRTVIGKLPKNDPTIPILKEALQNRTLYRSAVGIDRNTGKITLVPLYFPTQQINKPKR